MGNKLLLCFGVDIKSKDGSIEMARTDIDSIRRSSNTNNIAFMGIERVRLIVTSLAYSNLSFSNSKENVVWAGCGPDHTSDRTGLEELVTNRLSFFPFSS